MPEMAIDEILSLPLTEALKRLTEWFPDKVVFSTSFSAEDQLISHYIFANKLPIRVFTLDTGRLFQETYSTWSKTLDAYQARIEPYSPDAKELDAFTVSNGPNPFYKSVELRKACCHIRKVVPLNAALRGQKVWITGIRAEHSPDRTRQTMVEWDSQRNLFKFNPLLNYTTEQVMKEIREKGIPYNPLHDKGFVSIGCLPCTRAIQPGEDFRAGRWWWEDAANKECGLHVNKTH